MPATSSSTLNASIPIKTSTLPTISSHCPAVDCRKTTPPKATRFHSLKFLVILLLLFIQSKLQINGPKERYTLQANFFRLYDTEYSEHVQGNFSLFFLSVLRIDSLYDQSSKDMDRLNEIDFVRQYWIIFQITVNSSRVIALVLVSLRFVMAL